MLIKKSHFLAFSLAFTAFIQPVSADEIHLDSPTWQLSQHSTLSAPAIQFSAAANPVVRTTIFGLPENMGPLDRSLRALIALGLVGTGVYGLSSGQISTPISAALLGVSAIPIATAATGYCPLYQVFGVNYSF